MNLSDLVKGILTGNIQKGTLSKQQLEDVIDAIALMKAALSPEQQKKNREKAIAESNERAFRAAKITKPKKSEEPKKPNHLVVIKDEGCLAKSEENVSWSSNGQWSLEKAIKPGPTLDYGKMSPEQNPVSNPAAAKEAKAQRYAEIEANAPTLDYRNNRAATPKYYEGAAQKAQAAKAKAIKESQETAVETFQRRGQAKKPAAPVAPAAPAAGTLKPTMKSEGANIEKEPTPEERRKMTAKSDAVRYGSKAEEAMMAMSEKEPHTDDPKHEQKEKNKAKKIKDEAQELIDMHN